MFVKAEMAQIETIIKIELEASKLSWWDMARTPGMQRRTFSLLRWDCIRNGVTAPRSRQFNHRARRSRILQKQVLPRQNSSHDWLHRGLH